MQRYKSNLY